MPARYRSIRGITAIAVLADEIAYWFSEEDSRNPDTEILGAVRPALATTGGPLIAISSPHARRGELWEAYRRHFGPAGDAAILVAQGASRILNPSLPQRVLDRAYDRDPARAAAEYGAVFRSDVESLVPSEVVDACIERGVYERPPASRTHYLAFTDPSGGSADSFTLAIGHREGDVAVSTPSASASRHSPRMMSAASYAELLKSYGVSTVHGDRYAGEWPRERFLTHGIVYKPAERTKSEIYGAMLPLLNSSARTSSICLVSKPSSSALNDAPRVVAATASTTALALTTTSPMPSAACWSRWRCRLGRSSTSWMTIQ